MIRIMWEMNGNWFPWGVQSLSAAQYISIYQAAERAFAAVPGNQFQYVWNVNAGTAESGRTEFDTYPGSAYVSNVGFDYYDYGGTSESWIPRSWPSPLFRAKLSRLTSVGDSTGERSRLHRLHRQRGEQSGQPRDRPGVLRRWQQHDHRVSGRRSGVHEGLRQQLLAIASPSWSEPAWFAPASDPHCP